MVEKDIQIVILGSVAMDSIKTPLGDVEKVMGGSGTYTAISSSYFDVGCGLISVVGADFPHRFRNTLDKHNIDISGLSVHKQSKTLFWKGRYLKNMNKRETLELEVSILNKFIPSIPEGYKNPKVLMLGNISPKTQLELINSFNENKPKFIVLDTIDHWIKKDNFTLKKVIKQSDLMVINEDEARLLSKEYSLIKAAKKILMLGAKYIVIKKGENGALLFDKNNNIFFCPSYQIEDVFDPTGAGDSFAGGMIGYIAKTNNYSFENIKKSIIYASVMGSFCVEKFGIEKISDITKENIEKRREELLALTRI